MADDADELPPAPFLEEAGPTTVSCQGKHPSQWNLGLPKRENPRCVVRTEVSDPADAEVPDAGYVVLREAVAYRDNELVSLNLSL